MSDPVSAVVPHALPQAAKESVANSQQGVTRSFQAVLQDGGTRPRTVTNAGSQAGSEGVSGAELERLRSDLARRLNRMPSGDKSLDQIWPELLRTHTRMGMLREAMKGMNNTPTGANLKGLFGTVEGEWFNLEQIMRSDKDLSSGELLGLQARLYQVSQHIDVMSKVVDQMTSGIKTILNTNV
jgi:hypothetical protein